MAIPSGITIMWDGAHSAIPSGWARETTLDDVFLKGTANGVNPNVTGGAATHTHTTDNIHDHPYAAHTHAYVTGMPTLGISRYPQTNNLPASNVSHSGTSGSVGGTSGTAAPSWDTLNSEPSHFEPIFIKSDGTPMGFPQDSQVFQNGSTLPTGWIQHIASKEIFMKGAPTSSGDGGGTGGGAHTHTGSSHTHTYPSHQHGSSTSSASAGNVTGGHAASGCNNPGTGYNTLAHSHSVSFTSSGGATSGAQSDANASEANEPEFFTLWCLDNTSAGTDYLDSVIVMWLGTLGNIPTGYLICDGTNDTPDLRGKFIKIATTSGNIGATGGAAGHTHTTTGHTHTSSSHTHALSVAAWGTQGNSNWAQGGTLGEPLYNHPHPGPSMTGMTPTLTSVSMTTDSTADTQPPFRTVAFIFTPEEASGNLGVFGSNF